MASRSDGAPDTQTALMGGPGPLFRPIHTVLATFVQVAAVVLYAILTFALPKSDQFFQTSNHITVLHAGCWVIVVVSGLWVERETRNALTRGYINLYRKVRLFGQLPVIITTLFNFGLLVLLGLDTWIEAETGDDPISLVVLQVVACVEALIILAAGLRFMWIIRDHNLGSFAPDVDLTILGQRRRSSESGYGGTDDDTRPFPSMDERSFHDLLAATITVGSTPELSRAQQVIKGLKEERVRMQREVDRINAELVDRVTGAAPAGAGDDLRRYAEDAVAQRRIASQRALNIVALQDEVRALEDEKAALARELRSTKQALKAERSRAQKLEMYLNIERETYQRVKGHIEDMHYVSAGEATDSTLGFSMSGLLAAGVAAEPAPVSTPVPAASIAVLPDRALSPVASPSKQSTTAAAIAAAEPEAVTASPVPVTGGVGGGGGGGSNLRSPIAATALPLTRQLQPVGASAVGGSLNGSDVGPLTGSYSGTVQGRPKAPDEMLLAMQARRKDRVGKKGGKKRKSTRRDTAVTGSATSSDA